MSAKLDIAPDSPLAFALRYAAAGLRVLPLHHAPAGRCTCGNPKCESPGKHPRAEHGAKDASTSEGRIIAWWTRWPEANIGLTLEGLVAVDIDPRNGGDPENLSEPLPETCIAKTGGGGLHYLYRAANGAKYPGSLARGIDCKSGPGAYIVVEPSVHASGERYVWIDESEPWGRKPEGAPHWLANGAKSQGLRHEPRGDDEPAGAITLLTHIEQGRALHDSLRDLAAHYVALKLPFAEVCALLESTLRASRTPHDERWQARLADIPKLVDSAIQKFARPGPQASKAAALAWRSLEGRTPPERAWAIRFWLGMGHPTLLVGPSGAGKTLLCQQMASAISIGRAFLGEVARPARVLMWACEDDHDELWRRQQAIARWLGVASLGEFDAFMLVPRAGLENTLFATMMGSTGWTPLLAQLVEQANDHRADIVILDNLAQIFGGNENSRHETTSFVNGLHGALGLQRALALIGHPSRQPGSEFSGSSAWEAAVRMRLYFASRLPDQKPEEDIDSSDPNLDNVRWLAKRKANYTEHDTRRFTFEQGVLTPDALADSGGIIGTIRRDRAQRVVIEAAKKLEHLGIRFAPDPRSRAYLPKVIAQYKFADGCSKPDLAQATRDAIVERTLEITTGWSGSRNKVEVLRVATTSNEKIS